MAKPLDKDRLNKIIKIVEKSGEGGIWIRELSRQSKIPVATVHYYIKKHLQNKVKIESARIGGIEHKQMKIVRMNK